jgi:putative MATE family efflux protein
MGTQPIWGLLLRFSGPATISMAVASSYGVVDAIFVGRLGATALAAMSVTFPLMLSFVAIASGTAIGVTSVISRSLGAGDTERADRAAAVAVSLSFLLSALVAMVCLPNLDGILRMLGATGPVLLPAKDFISIIIYSTVFSYVNTIMPGVIRSDGNPIFSSVVGISSVLVNIILDPLFIFGLGPLPPMGIKGAAIATAIAQVLGTGTYVYYMASGRTAYRFSLGHFLPRWDIVAEIYRVGTASIVRSGAQFVVMGVINKTAASFGVTPLAIMGVLMRTGRFIQMPVLGLGQGMLPLLGFNFGAKNKDRVGELLFKTTLASTVWTTVCWLAIMVFPLEVMSGFNSGTEFLREGEQAVRLFSLAYFTLGIRMVPGFFFQGIGKSLPAIVLTVAQNILFLLPFILLLPRQFGLAGMWLAFPATDALALLVGVTWLFIELRRQRINVLKRRPELEALPDGA